MPTLTLDQHLCAYLGIGWCSRNRASAGADMQGWSTSGIYSYPIAALKSIQPFMGPKRTTSRYANWTPRPVFTWPTHGPMRQRFLRDSPKGASARLIWSVGAWPFAFNCFTSPLLATFPHVEQTGKPQCAPFLIEM